MPCPHFSISIAKRSKGQSAVAAAAYQSGSRLYCEHDLQWKRYTHKKEILHSEIMLPTHAPPEFQDRQTLWNSVESAETRWNSQLARKIVAALPVEVPPGQYPDLVRDFCREHFVSKGMCCDFSIHDKGDGNPHAHIMLSMRALDEEGKWMPKSRMVCLTDADGNRIRLPSGNYKSRKVDTVDWNDKKYAEIWRHGWEEVNNRYLEKCGSRERLDMRSYERQGKTIAPTVHLGPGAFRLERKGKETFLGSLNRKIQKTNQLYEDARKEASFFAAEISALDGEIGKAVQEASKEGAEVKNTKSGHGVLIEDAANISIPSLLLQFMDAREVGCSGWGRTARQKGSAIDLKKVSALYVYLQDHKISTLDDLARIEVGIRTNGNATVVKKRAKEKRIREIGSILASVEKKETLQPIYDKFSRIMWKRAKEKFSEVHQEELDAYRKAYRHLKKVSPEGEMDTVSLEQERRKLCGEVEKLKERIEPLSAELKDIQSILSIIRSVNPEIIKVYENSPAFAGIFESDNRDDKKMEPKKRVSIRGKIARNKERLRQREEERKTIGQKEARQKKGKEESL